MSCQHELSLDAAHSLDPRCTLCSVPLPEVAAAIAEQDERDQREQAKPTPSLTADAPPPAGASKEEVRRYQRHQRMKQRGHPEQIGYRGG